MKIETKTEVIQTVTITYNPGEKVKALAYCYDNEYDIKSTIDPGTIVASKVISPEEHLQKIS